MNAVNPGSKTRDLLKIAEEYRADQCQVLLTRANAECRSILKAAHLAARSELRAMLAPERERLAAEIASAEAKLVTQRRMHEQRRIQGILRQAWPRLVQALQARWETAAGRTAWVMQHLALALSAMPAEGWLIRHAQNWPAAEREQTDQWLQTHGIAGARFEADRELSAGIRIVCGLNVLDASLDGLLADRTQIEGRLLHYLGQEQ